MKAIRLQSFLFTLLICSYLSAQTTLNAGDLVFTGYSADGPNGGEDEFSFLLLKDVTTGTTIRFTDFGWCSGVDITGFQTPNPCGASTGAVSDGIIQWNATSDVPCGTEIMVQGRTLLTATTGTITGIQGTFNTPSQYINLASGGEALFAYQGTEATPSFISAINMDGGWDATLSQCTFTSGGSTLPSTLNSTNSIIVLPENDNAKYNCNVVNGKDAIRTAALNSDNWDKNNTTAFTLPTGCTFSCTILGTDDHDISNYVSLYPNPVKDNKLYIETSNRLIVKDISLYDLSGKKVYSKELNPTETFLSLDKLAKGIYMVKLTSDSGSLMKKVIFQ